MATAAGDSVVPRRTASLVLKPLSDCKDLPLLQRRASKCRPAGVTDSDAAASRLSNYRYNSAVQYGSTV